MSKRAVVLLVAVALVAAAVLLAPAPSTDSRPAKPSVTRPPVVMLVLDEFPVDALLTPDGQIDGARFPNFARLAATSTWFPNATSDYDSTFKAVPAMLDARLPVKGSAPDARSHRRNIFTHFDRLRYGIVDTESSTALCPPSICRGARTRRPGVLLRLNRGGRPGRLRRWIRSIRPRARPTLYFQHALLPHEPWIYLPSGRQSRPAGNDPVPNVNRPPGFHDPELTRHNHLRYLLQTGYVDRQIGFLLARMRSLGLLDRAMVVVAADHGYSFELGTKDRRLVTESNVEQIAPVPLFIKLPGQREGRVNDAYVRSVDILPTIAGLLGTRLDWRHDGHSAFSEITRQRRALSIVTRDFSRTIRIDAAELERRRRAVRAARAEAFGTGFESMVVFGLPWARAYLIGPNANLIGTPLPAHLLRSGETRARVANGGLLARVSRRSRVLPTRVTGRLDGRGRTPLRNLAVGVNGRVAAVGRSFRLRGDRREWFSMMVPEESLHNGRNRVQVLEVTPGGRLLRLDAL